MVDESLIVSLLEHGTLIVVSESSSSYVVTHDTLMLGHEDRVCIVVTVGVNITKISSTNVWCGPYGLFRSTPDTTCGARG